MTKDSACACFGDTASPPDVAPGLSSIPWRLSTHGGFRAAMLDRLHTRPALARLTTRDSADPAIALVDGWAAMLDILAFYNERIGNEGFLRPSTERRSVLELARLIGYAPAPGVSASTWLAVQCDTIPGSPEIVTLPAGTGVMSVPGPDEKPQIFETGSELAARPAWQDLRAESLRYVAPAAGDTALMLVPPTNLRTGDMLLMIGDERRGSTASTVFQVRRVRAITEVPADPIDQAPARSEITLDSPLGPAAGTVPALSPRVHALRQRASLFGHNAPAWEALPLSMRFGEVLPIMQTMQTHAMMMIDSGGTEETVEAVRIEGIAYQDFVADTFTNLVDIDAITQLAPGIFASRQGSWADANFPATQTHVDLDQVYNQFVAGSWAVLVAGDVAKAYLVTRVSEVSANDYGMAQKVTRLALSGPSLADFSPRSTSVFGVSDQMAWAMTPVTTPVSGNQIVLNSRTAGLTAGRMVALSGTVAATGLPYARILMLDRAETLAGGGAADALAPPAPQVSRLHFASDIGAALIARTVRLNANVVSATHGETREDAIGSGNAAVPFQTVPLPQKPLTFVSAPVGNGRATTLSVQVGGSWWQECRHLADAKPADRVFATRTADDGTVTLLFGDGINGARPPSGSGNIIARYRTGTGLRGMLKAGQISQPLQRPAGLAGLGNPLAATGAEEAEGRDTARINAPGTVKAMERIVSIADVADFARAFGGIGKADARLMRHGASRAVVLTVADTLGGDLLPEDALYRNLDAAISAARSGSDYAGQRHGLPVVLTSLRPAALVLHAQIVLATDAAAEITVAAAQSALLSAFAFAARDFGQPASLAEAAAVLHGVNGVRAVRFQRFHLHGTTATVAAVVAAGLPERSGDDWLGAELLTLNAANLQLTEVV